MWLQQQKQFFFCTAQTVVFDIRAGTCPLPLMILIVVDEAHNACGDHALAVVVRQRLDVNPHFRLLALSATPGKGFTEVKNLVLALKIEKIVSLTREDPNVRKYVNQREETVIQVQPTAATGKLMALFNRVCEIPYRRLTETGMYLPGTVSDAAKFHDQALIAHIMLSRTEGFEYYVPALGASTATGEGRRLRRDGRHRRSHAIGTL